MQAQHKLVCVNVSDTWDPSAGSLDNYRNVLGFWRLDTQKANTYDYICAVYNGAVCEVYEATQWVEVDEASFGPFSDGKSRSQWHGKLAPNNVRNLYVGQTVTGTQGGRYIEPGDDLTA